MQQIIKIEGYEWKEKEGFLDVKKNIKAVNAFPALKRRVVYTHWRKKTKREVFVVVFQYASGKESDEIVISDDELSSGKYIDKIPIDVVIYVGYRKKIIEVFRILLQEQMENCLTEEVVEYEQGWNGNKFQWPDEEGGCTQECIGDRYGHAMELAKLMGASKYILIAVLAAIHGVLRRLLNMAGITHNFVTYLEGETGVGKTDIAKKIGNYHPKMNTFFALNSDKRQLKRQIHGLRDGTLILDDFCISDSVRIRERQLDLVSEIIQNASDSGKILIGGIEPCEEIDNIHLMVTAEKKINNFSTLNRCFLITMEEKLSDTVWNGLNDFAKSGKMYGFMRDFVVWIEDNYDEIINRMRTNYQEYISRAKKKMRYEVPGIERIRCTIAVQLTLSKCLIDYFYCMQIEGKVLERAVRMLNCCIWEGGEEMCRYMLEQQNKKNMLQYLPTLADMIVNVGNRIWVASTEEIYHKYLYQEGRDGVCIGVCLNSGYLSFDPNRICELIAEELHLESVSPKSLGAELKYYSLVHVDCEGKLSCRWHSKKRMYHVHIKELIELIYPEEGLSGMIERISNQ